MANSYPMRYYRSWDSKITVVQETRDEVVKDPEYSTKLVTRFQVSNTQQTINVKTNWIDYPLPENTCLASLLLKKIPALKQMDYFLPLVEQSSTRRKHALTCSTLILKDGKRIKQYMPIASTIHDFDIYKSIPSSFTVSDGEHIYLIKPRDVLEITEE
jgi:hypothetical protein